MYLTKYSRENMNEMVDIFEAIREFDTIIIHRHVNPDPDAIGSQGGLQAIIQHSFPTKKVYAVGEEVKSLHFLHRMDSISDDMYQDALVIVCDTGNQARISDERFNTGKKLIKIDHHPNVEPYGDIQWVNTSYSSTCEMLVDFMVFLESYYTPERLEMKDEAARLLYAGMIGDTGRFKYDNTKSRTLECASVLLRYNFNPQDIYNEFYKTTRAVAKLHGHILQHFEVTGKGVASMYISEELMKEFGVNATEASNLVNVLSDIEGNKIWVFFVEKGDDIRVRIRSKEIVIGGVAQQFNGGGHPLASGATVWSREEAQQLIEALDELL